MHNIVTYAYFTDLSYTCFLCWKVYAYYITITQCVENLITEEPRTRRLPRIWVFLLPGFPWHLIELSRSVGRGFLSEEWAGQQCLGPNSTFWDVRDVQHILVLPSGPTLIPHMCPKPHSTVYGLQLCPVCLPGKPHTSPTLSRPSGITHGGQKRKTLKKKERKLLGKSKFLLFSLEGV